MLLEVGLLAAGIPAGWLLRRKRKVQLAAGATLTWTVRLLLLLLGLGLGADERLAGQLESLGLRAALIGLAAVAGSLLAGRLLARWLEPGKTG